MYRLSGSKCKKCFLEHKHKCPSFHNGSTYSKHLKQLKPQKTQNHNWIQQPNLPMELEDMLVCNHGQPLPSNQPMKLLMSKQHPSHMPMALQKHISNQLTIGLCCAKHYCVWPTHLNYKGKSQIVAHQSSLEKQTPLTCQGKVMTGLETNLQTCLRAPSRTQIQNSWLASKYMEAQCS